MCVRGRQGERRRKVEKAPCAVSTCSYRCSPAQTAAERLAARCISPTSDESLGPCHSSVKIANRQMVVPSQGHRASYYRLLPLNQPQTRIPNARSHMPSTAHHGTLAVMPFLGHDNSLIGRGLTNDKLAAGLEPSLSSLSCHPVIAPANE